MRQDPIISGAVLKAALVILVAGALGVGAYVLASGVDINLPDLPDVNTSAETTLSDTTLEDTTIGEQEPATTTRNATTTTTKSSGPTIEDLQALGQCVQGASGDIDKVNACFDRFNGK
jgi:hypothetical protein